MSKLPPPHITDQFYSAVDTSLQGYYGEKNPSFHSSILLSDKERKKTYPYWLRAEPFTVIDIKANSEPFSSVTLTALFFPL